MTVRVLSPTLAKRAAELAKNGMPPQPIRVLMDDIEGDIRVAKLRQTVTGQVDSNLAVAISQKKRQLDGLYLDWVEEKNVSFPNQER